MTWTGRDDPELLVMHLLQEGQEVRVFRAIQRDEPTPHDFRSGYERGKAARRIERRSATLWMSLSTTTTFEATASRIRRFPPIGTHVAEVVLVGGEGFAVAETLDETHRSVWGDPFKLAKRVVEVYPAE